MLKKFSSLYPSDIAAWLLAVTVYGVMALAGWTVGLRHPSGQGGRDAHDGVETFE